VILGGVNMIELYNDNFSTIFISNNKGYYASALLDYKEFSPSIAVYIADKCKNDIIQGYKLIGLLDKIRGVTHGRY
jgi:hypothetical protein